MALRNAAEKWQGKSGSKPVVDVTALGVTVVVPTLNRGRYLIDTLTDLLAQHHRPLEILVVDQSDTVTPELERLVQAHPDVVTHCRVTFRGLPNARNFGWQRARHDIIVYVDDDIRCDSHLVSRYVAELSNGTTGICGGGVDEIPARIVEKPGRFNRWKALPSGVFSSHETLEVDHVKGCNFAARRDVLRQLGGFDEGLNVGAALHEETDFMLRARESGYRTMFAGNIRLTHLAAGTGGTRQPDYRRYVHALSHNRSVLIRRHSAWYQWPTGLAYSAKLMAAYASHAHGPLVILPGLYGMVQGWGAGGKAPACTSFVPDPEP